MTILVAVIAVPAGCICGGLAFVYSLRRYMIADIEM